LVTVTKFRWFPNRVFNILFSSFIAAQDPLYKGVPMPPPVPTSIEGPPVLTQAPEHVEYDTRPSYGKELPTKMNMHERVQKWLEVSKPPKYEKEHHTIHKQISSETSL
jgi:hypothetical protein